MTMLNNTIQRILVVDDDPNEMKSLLIGLRLEGFTAAGTSSGSEALQMLADNSYCVVLIDLMMPGMNGLQLARAIRSTYPMVTTMLMSAYHLSPVQLARADTGVVGFVPKPFCFEELVKFIQTKIDPESVVRSDSKRLVATLNVPIEIPAVITDRPSQIPSPPLGLRESSSTK